MGHIPILPFTGSVTSATHHLPPLAHFKLRLLGPAQQQRENQLKLLMVTYLESYKMKYKLRDNCQHLAPSI